MSEYTYQEYLNTWEAHYGNDDTGEFEYYSYGVKRSKFLKRMTEEQFNSAVEKLNEFAKQIDNIFNQPVEIWDEKELDRLMDESFDYELALFC